MPRFAANLSLLFTERPFLERFAAAAHAGFQAVEIQFPYDHEPSAVRDAAEAAGVEIALFNFPAGDLVSGGPGLAAMPERTAEFEAAVETGLRYADAIKPRCMNVLPGAPPETADKTACLETLVRNLRHAADAAAGRGITVTTEFVNRESRPGFLLGTAAETIAALNLADRQNLAMQFDIFHAAIMEQDILESLKEHLPRIGHVQFADWPGRGEPGTGRLDFDTLFAALDEFGYQGWAGAEYKPTKKTEETLGWLRKWSSRQGGGGS